jgi:hypothetical protein
MLASDDAVDLTKACVHVETLHGNGNLVSLGMRDMVPSRVGT